MDKKCKLITKQNGRLKKQQVGERIFSSEYYDENSYSSWKRIPLNKHIKNIDHVGDVLIPNMQTLLTVYF